MPYKEDREKLDTPFLDRRNKMLPCQKEMAKYWYERGKTITYLSRMFRVSKQAIRFIVIPGEEDKHKQRLAERKAYRAPGKSKLAVLRTRKYKHKLLNKFIEWQKDQDYKRRMAEEDQD